MKKSLLTLQSSLLLAGTLFSGFTVIKNFGRFYQSEGTLFKIYDCAVPNPVTEACFYGSIGFLTAFVWSLFILKHKNQTTQKYLWWFLGAGTIFAFFNVTKEFLAFYTSPTGQVFACGGQPLTNPFLTPCFTGANIFLLATIVSAIILWQNNKLISKK